MRNYILFASLTVLAYANIPNLAPIDNDDIETFKQEINLTQDFQKISVDGNIQLEISSGPYSLTSITYQQDKNEIYTEIKDGTLYIAEKKPSASWSKFFNWRSSDNSNNVKLLLTLPDLRSLRMHSMSYAIIKSHFYLNNIVLSGASKLHIEPDIYISNLTIKLRGFSRMTSANIASNLLEIMQSDMSTFNASEITTKSFISRSHDQCLQHITAINSDETSSFITGQGRTEVDKVVTSSLKINLSGASIYRAKQVRVKELEARMSGSSELRISQGSAKQSKLISHNHSNYAFDTFKPGALIEVDTTRDG
ncbi:DUF2807 domain-containing protein [Gammaproteobacteria bacterium]|nr:DUF2807 domain-containing protein [Gammaproteobacteria bacterium]